MRLLGNEIYKLLKMKKIYLFLWLLCAMTLLTVYVFYNGREMGWHTVLETGNVHALLMANTTGLGHASIPSFIKSRVFISTYCIQLSLRML